MRGVGQNAERLKFVANRGLIHKAAKTGGKKNKCPTHLWKVMGWGIYGPKKQGGLRHEECGKVSRGDWK